MTFTPIDPSLPSDSHWVRWRIGDGVENRHYLEDETIEALIATTSNRVEAARAAVLAILAQIAKQTDRSAVGFSSTRSQETEHYRSILEDLERDTNRTAGAEMFVGGVSNADAAGKASDLDRRTSGFAVGMSDYYAASRFRGRWP